jgi:hypothetical protein
MEILMMKLRCLLVTSVAVAVMSLTMANIAAADESIPYPPEASGISLETVPREVGFNATPGPSGVKPLTCEGGECIVCTPSGDNPHKSTHEPTTINVVVKVTCTEPVPTITLHAGMYHWNGSAWELSCCNTKSVIAKTKVSENYAVPCVPGWYQGYNSYHVQFVNGSTGESSGSVGKEQEIKSC